MANFKARFDEAATEARRLVVSNGSEIRDILPGFSGSDFDRLTRSISSLLEKVDKKQVDHPEYLAHTSGNIAEYSVTVITGVTASLETGATHFVQTTLPTILLCEERLVRAVGHYYFKVKDVKERQIREIEKLAEESIGYRESTRKSNESIKELQKQAAETVSLLQTYQADANSAASKINETRTLVSRLATGDGRGKSLEALKRTAEDKLASIEEVLTKANDGTKTVESVSGRLQALTAELETAKAEIQGVRAEADAVLSLSSQAGLASSYLRESKKLAVRSYIFTGILYATSVATAVIAAVYVLPSLEHSLSANGGTLAQRAIPVTLLRATVLAPLVYVIYFTTRQVSSLETLRMDYAEKAAASLAYSGYKDEMSEDTSLLDRWRGSLLLKFAEHPERLLRKRPVRDSIQVETPGFRATSSSAEIPVAADVLETERSEKAPGKSIRPS